jgi:hypothetical protein
MEKHDKADGDGGEQIFFGDETTVGAIDIGIGNWVAKMVKAPHCEKISFRTHVFWIRGSRAWALIL